MFLMFYYIYILDPTYGKTWATQPTAETQGELHLKFSGPFSVS